jgi:multiple sugar transport system ATP-binding protein
MSHVELQHITKQFPGVTALDDISFDVKDGEFFVLLGPTGAGKTTTLRVIAGLEHQDAGAVLFDGEAIDTLTPSDRDVALVFQQYSLYPTMSVFDNLAFPLRSPLRRTSEEEVRKKVDEAQNCPSLGWRNAARFNWAGYCALPACLPYGRTAIQLGCEASGSLTH